MKSTFSRIFTIATVILLLALVLIGTFFQFLVRNYLTDHTMDALLKEAQSIAALASNYAGTDGSGLRTLEFQVNLDVAADVTDSDVLVFDTRGYMLRTSDTLGLEEHGVLVISKDFIRQIAESGAYPTTGTIPGLYDSPRNLVAAPIFSPGTDQCMGMVLVSRPVDSISMIMGRISNIFLMVSMLVVLMAIIAMSFFARQQSAPLRTMTQTAVAFGHGNLNVRVPVDESYPEDVENLARAFNNMAQELQKSEYQRQEFVANVSHELKTPMTTISGYIDGILDGTIPPERQRHYLTIVSDETKRLSRLVRSMLDISRLHDQDGIPEEKKIHFDMEECAGQVLITFEQKINDKGLEVEVDMPDHPMYTRADPDAVTQVIYNLIDNAVKFCPQGGTLGLQIQEGGNRIYTSISNTGDTIPAEELPLVFDRFHKLDKSRTKNRDGWGLGLYIVKTIVCSHGEDISVTSQNGKTTFTFTMPLVN